MQVENATGQNLLDMTWVRVLDILENYELFQTLRAGKGLSAEQHLMLQKANRDNATNK